MAPNNPPVEGDSQNPTPCNTEDNFNKTLRCLVVTQVFTQELEQNFKECGLEHCAFLCDILRDSLDMLSTKLTDEIFTSKAVV